MQEPANGAKRFFSVMKRARSTVHWALLFRWLPQGDKKSSSSGQQFPFLAAFHPIFRKPESEVAESGDASL